MATQPIYLLSTGLLPADLIQLAATKGIVLDSMSFISIEPVTDEALGAGLRVLGDRRITAVFTSTNAVEAVKQWMGRAPDWRIFCTGGTTRSAIADYFGEAAIAGTAESAVALAEEMMAAAGKGESGERGQEIFFFCGDQRREELPVLLRAEGLTVNEWVVYRTILTPQKTSRAYAGIAFFSPSAVESYFSLHTMADDVTLFAIGRTTGAALQARCPNPVIIGDRPEKKALVLKMIDQFQNE